MGHKESDFYAYTSRLSSFAQHFLVSSLFLLCLIQTIWTKNIQTTVPVRIVPAILLAAVLCLCHEVRTDTIPLSNIRNMNLDICNGRVKQRDPRSASTNPRKSHKFNRYVGIPHVSSV